MALTSTKATAPLNIDAPWSKWVRASTTEKPSAAFSPRTYRARTSELRTARYLQKLGWSLLAHDVRIFHIQVDLLMRQPSGLLTLIEVKTQTPSGVAHLNQKQFKRLMRVASFLAEFEPVEMRMAYVYEREIEILPVDGLTGI